MCSRRKSSKAESHEEWTLQSKADSSTPAAQSSSSLSRQQKSLITSNKSREAGEKLKMADFVRVHGNSLPLRVSVVEGYWGSGGRFVISSGDIYNFHFIKNERVVSIQDCSKNKFSIPLNSAIKFGLLYNPTNNFKKALKGHFFTSVSQIARAHPLPVALKVVSCCRPKVCSNQQLEVGEVLLVERSGMSLFNRPVLKVYSISKQEDKYISDECGATYATTPSELQVHLSDIVEVLSDGLPLEAMMYPSNQGTDDLPPHLMTEKVTITHTSIESAVIATTCLDEKSNKNSKLPISIPIEMDIDITVLEVSEKTLHQVTNHFLRHFDLSRVKDVEETPDLGRARKRCGSRICRRARQDYDYWGVNFYMSDKVYRQLDSIPESLPFRLGLNQPLPAFFNEATDKDLLLPSSFLPSKPSQESSAKGWPPSATKPTPTKAPPNPATPTNLPPKPQMMSMPHLCKSETPPTLPARNTKSSSEVTPKSINISSSAIPKDHAKSSSEVISKPKTSDNLTPPSATHRDYSKSLSPTQVQRNSDKVDWSIKFVPSTKTIPKSISLDLRNPPPGAMYNPIPVKPPSIPNLRDMKTPSSPPDKNKANRVTAGEACGRNVSSIHQQKLTLELLKEEVDHVRKTCYGQMNAMKEEIARLSEAMEELKLEHEVLRMGLAQSRGLSASPDDLLCTNTVTTDSSTATAHEPHAAAKREGLTSKEKENLAALRALSHSEILSLLDAMKLSMYKNTFSEEPIDGEVLAECDEDILEVELGVANKLHRVKLMKLITGKHSAQRYFSGGSDLYEVASASL